MAYNNYLDFYNIFVNELVGSPTLFIFLVYLITSILLVKARATLPIYMVVLFSLSLILGLYFEAPLVLGAMAGFGIVGMLMMKLRRES